MKNKFEVSVLQCADAINQKKKEVRELEEKLKEVELYQKYLKAKSDLDMVEMKLELEESRVIAFIVQNKLDKVVCNGYEYKVKDNSRESVEIIREEDIPADLFRTKKVPDKAAILNLYRNTGVLTSGTNIVRNPKYKLTVKKVKEKQC